MSPSRAHLISREFMNGLRHAHRRPSARSGLASAAAAVALLGAGTYGYATTQASPGGDSSTAASAVAARPVSLYDRVLGPGELAGFSPEADPGTVPTAAYWAIAARSGSSQLETRRLEKLGFEAGISEQLLGPAQAHAASVAERFRTASGARAELQYQYTKAAQGDRRSFPVIGIPSARGVSIATGRSTIHEVLFTAGHDYYLVGVRTASHGANVVSGPQVAAAAGALYLTVNGCTAARVRPDGPR